MNKFIFLLLFSLYSLSTYSQGKLCLENTSKQKAESILSHNISAEIEGKNHLLFTIKDEWYLIIIKEADYFEKYFITSDTIIKQSNKKCFKKKKENKILALAFDKKGYHNGYINLNSDLYSNGYELSQGNVTYFYLKDDKGNKYGESKLTTIIKPNPINDKVYNYLLTKLLCCIEEYE